MSDHFFYDVVVGCSGLVSFFGVGSGEIDVPDLLRFESATVDLEPGHRAFLLVDLSVEEFLVSMELGTCWEYTDIELVFRVRNVPGDCYEYLG